MAIFTTLCGEIHNSIQHKLQNSMEVDSVGIIAILSMPYITTSIVKTQTNVAKIPRVLEENQITTLSVVKIAIRFSPCCLNIPRTKKIHWKKKFPDTKSTGQKSLEKWSTEKRSPHYRFPQFRVCGNISWCVWDRRLGSIDKN